ncbi:hypothetical protein DL766_005500 [Monosporascus sp. MC13-8B]|nr:hypothetical protein DL766_005500 [Monosporascus sp. MC13-8B]
MADRGGARGGGFASRGDRGGDRGRGRGRGRGRRGGAKDSEKEWQPVTKLGRLVKAGKIKSMEEIYLHSLPIKEYQIVDFFLPKLKDEVMKIKPVQKQTRAGQRTRFKAIVIIGDSEGHVGLGIKTSKEVATAIRAAIIIAKLSVIPVRRGYWGTNLGLPHSLPVKESGKCGSVTVRLIPAPRGTQIVASPAVKRLLQLAGIEDAYTSSSGSTKTLENTLKATFAAISNTYGFLTPNLWSETQLIRSPLEEYADTLREASILKLLDLADVLYLPRLRTFPRPSFGSDRFFPNPVLQIPLLRMVPPGPPPGMGRLAMGALLISPSVLAVIAYPTLASELQPPCKRRRCTKQTLRNGCPAWAGFPTSSPGLVEALTGSGNSSRGRHRAGDLNSLVPAVISDAIPPDGLPLLNQLAPSPPCSSAALAHGRPRLAGLANLLGNVLSAAPPPQAGKIINLVTSQAAATDVAPLANALAAPAAPSSVGGLSEGINSAIDGVVLGIVGGAAVSQIPLASPTGGTPEPDRLCDLSHGHGRRGSAGTAGGDGVSVPGGDGVSVPGGGGDSAPVAVSTRGPGAGVETLGPLELQGLNREQQEEPNREQAAYNVAKQAVRNLEEGLNQDLAGCSQVQETGAGDPHLHGHHSNEHDASDDRDNPLELNSRTWQYDATWCPRFWRDSHLTSSRGRGGRATPGRGSYNSLRPRPQPELSRTSNAYAADARSRSASVYSRFSRLSTARDTPPYAPVLDPNCPAATTPGTTTPIGGGAAGSRPGQSPTSNPPGARSNMHSRPYGPGMPPRNKHLHSEHSNNSNPGRVVGSSPTPGLPSPGVVPYGPPPAPTTLASVALAWRMPDADQASAMLRTRWTAARSPATRSSSWTRSRRLPPP